MEEAQGKKLKWFTLCLAYVSAEDTQLLIVFPHNFHYFLLEHQPDNLETSVGLALVWAH